MAIPRRSVGACGSSQGGRSWPSRTAVCRGCMLRLRSRLRSRRPSHRWWSSQVGTSSLARLFSSWRLIRPAGTR